MWFLISWLLQKPADLDLHCLQEKPADQDPYCLQESIYIWFHTVFERINCLSTVRYKLICFFRQVKFSIDKYIFWLFTCPWTSRKFYYFHTPAQKSNDCYYTKFKLIYLNKLLGCDSSGMSNASVIKKYNGYCLFACWVIFIFFVVC